MVKIERHPSLALADKVLTEIGQLAGPFPASTAPPNNSLYVKPYSNCREQGWHLIYKSNAVSICEHRCSDDIRIWYGPAESFDSAGVPSELSVSTGTTNDRTFSSTSVKEAATFAFYYLVLQGEDPQ